MAKYAGRELTLSIVDSSDEDVVGQVVTLGNAGSSRNLIDASAYGDDWMDYVVGQQDGSEVAAEIAYDPDDGGHGALITLYDSGVPGDFEMDHESAGFHVGFPALITKCERGGARDGLLVLDVTFKILNPGVEDVSS